MFVAGLILTGCKNEVEELKPAKVSVPKKAEFVDRKLCIECHEEQYVGWRATRHPYKLQEADPETVIGDFAITNTFEAGGVTNRMTIRNGAYFIETAHGTNNAIQTFRVRYVIGGLWKQRYITQMDNGALMILPVQWNVKLSAWGDYHGLHSKQPGSGDYWSDPGRA